MFSEGVRSGRGEWNKPWGGNVGIGVMGSGMGRCRRRDSPAPDPEADSIGIRQTGRRLADIRHGTAEEKKRITRSLIGLSSAQTVSNLEPRTLMAGL